MIHSEVCINSAQFLDYLWFLKTVPNTQFMQIVLDFCWNLKNSIHIFYNWKYKYYVYYLLGSEGPNADLA